MRKAITETQKLKLEMFDLARKNPGIKCTYMMGDGSVYVVVYFKDYCADR